MTTKPKGITLPYYTNVQFPAAGIQVTDISGNYASNNATGYYPSQILALNPNASAGSIPASFYLTIQNAVASASSVGGGFYVSTGTGSNGNSSGNLVLKDTAGNGSGWNTAHYVMGAFHLWVDAKSRLRIKGAAPTTDLDGNVVGIDLSASGAYTPGSIGAGISVNTTLVVAGAVMGDLAICSFSLDTTNLIVTARVSAAGVVTVIMYNPTGGAITPGAGTLQVKVIKS